MAKLISIFLVALLLVLPSIIAAASCNIQVSQTKTSSANYVAYSASAQNTDSNSVTNIIITPSNSLKSVSLSSKSGGYAVPDLAPGASYSFTFSVKRGNTVSWTASCSPKQTTNPTTVAPTQKPSTGTTTQPPAVTTTKTPTSSSGRRCPAGSWWAPAPMTTWQWQLTGTVDTSVAVQMFDIDLFDATPALISTLQGQGKAVICYFSTQYENWRSDASAFTSAVIGKALDDWEGEAYADIRSSVVRNIINKRLDIAVSKGCDGVEPDNVDGYTADSGFPLTAADQSNFNQFLATQAHARGLSIGLKNDMDQVKSLEPYFDWALNEQCKEYSECGGYTAFTNAGKAVFNAEYSGTASSVCSSMNSAKISSLIKKLSLSAQIVAQCCTQVTGGCPAPAYTCKTASRNVRNVEENLADNNNNENIVDNNNDNNNNIEQQQQQQQQQQSQQQNEAAATAALMASATTTQISLAVVMAVTVIIALII